jgi:hypothetical protein
LLVLLEHDEDHNERMHEKEIPGGLGLGEIFEDVEREFVCETHGEHVPAGLA